MSLASGTRIGPYEIQSALGVGGMGEVYRAHDTKLNRDVAIKILPDAFANDPDRLQRFVREAQTLAALNHPNIAHIHGLEETPGGHALVMELVEGEDLSQRLAHGAIPLADALPIAKQIVEALEAAHEQGIVHRDLKPANIKVREDGTVKVLDFGLAKALDGGAGAVGGAGGLTHSPTMLNASMPGMILGTAAYMSPEQSKGRKVDRRTDIFAFGCVLFEMLTGRRAFEGDDVAEILSRVLQREPDWNLLPASVPPRLHELLRLCLEKNIKQRRGDASDVRLDLERAMRPSELAPAVAAPAPHRAAWATPLMTVALLAAGVLTGRLFLRGPASSPARVWMSVLPPPYGFTAIADPAVSPDGRTVAFVAPNAAGVMQVWLRALDAPDARAVPGSDGAVQPFWSPDGRWIGFFARGKVKKAPVAGGSPQTLADAPLPRGAAWSDRSDILFVPASFEPIHQTTASGGPSPRMTLSVPAAGQVQERQSYPHFLPDGRHFLFSHGTMVAVGTLGSSEVKEVAPLASKVEYANGDLFFVRDGDLYAQPFDPERIALSGEPTKVADNIGWTGQISTHFAFSTSPAGVLAYWDRSAFETSQLTWFDRSGNRIATLGEPGEYADLALSPDARRVAVEMHEPRGGRVSVWLIDAATGVRSRFTSYQNWTGTPLWSADSSRLLVTDFSEQMHVLPLAGGSPQEIAVGRGGKWPNDWSRDGRFVVFYENRETTDLGIVTTDGGAPSTYLQTSFNEWQAKISPDGSWLAYVSDEAGTRDVYLQTFPKTGRKLRVSINGGDEPVWRADGRGLFYLAANGDLMDVDLAAANGALEIRGFRVLFHPPRLVRLLGRTQYAVTADGRRFLFNVVVPDTSPKAITVILNWKTPAK